MNLYQGFGNNQSYYQPQRTNTILPPSQQSQPAFIGLKGRPVSSLEEARAAAIDKDLAETCYYVSIVEAMEDREDNEESNRQTDTIYYGIGTMDEDNKKMGHSPMKRKSYIESKEHHMDQAQQMRELEDYAQVLTSDLLEMIQNATPEEKQLLQRKIATLATKIV